MPVIYFDNFRGFNKTYLPLSNVNFFVGENSSGKTSVLKLINVLSDKSFWYIQGFNSEEADLGHFTEIASFANKEKKYFEVGILGDTKGDSEPIRAVKMKFANKEGLPTVIEVSLLHGNEIIQVRLVDNLLQFKNSKFANFVWSEAKKVINFKKWVERLDLNNSPWEDVEEQMEIEFFNDAPLFYAQSLLRSLRSKRKKTKGIEVRLGFTDFLEDVAWLAPIRTDPKRTYDSYKISFNPDGTHAPYLLKKLLSKGMARANKEEVERIIEKFGKDSGLFDKIIISPLGKGDTAPFELQVLLNGHIIKITNVGYGVSQILPLIVEVIARNKHTWFAFQQPEIHLHPRGQAAIGDFIFKSAVEDEKNFIIETHSDYTIDRFRLKVHEYNAKHLEVKIKSQIVFFRKIQGANTLVCIPILEDGSLPHKQPKAFKEFFIKEQLALLKI